ncbi:MAG TPA: hypothetical protein VHV83_03895 [Armatimonadota bacterium]|nr:hypothetical protein [Armatimonadota bacterium]
MREFWWQHLDGDGPIELTIKATIHDTHATTTDLTLQDIPIIQYLLTHINTPAPSFHT